MFRKRTVTPEHIKVGVAITTHNRPEVTDRAVKEWKKYLPSNAALIIVDDASHVAYPDADYRFEVNVGIARAKNKCFELLEDQGVTHYFLADNDCFPRTKNWWQPYVNSPEPHLGYQFLDLVGPVKLHDMTVLYDDGTHVAYSGQRGCLLYYTQECLDRVGGFDPIYGRALYEHCDLANRIHAAGLTTWRYADVAHSNELWYSLDEYVEVNRTVPKEEQNGLVKLNAAIHHKRKADGYNGYVTYRESVQAKQNVVITSLLTTNPDPQRGYKWNPDPALLAPWLESMERGGWKGIVLADELPMLPRGYSQEVVAVPSSSMNVYFQRWMHLYQHLRDHPEYKFVWCTDGTDVEVLRDPFENMAPGKLYVGSERGFVGSNWMKANHKAKIYQQFIAANSSKTLLNAGVVGADRETLIEFSHKIISIQNDIEAARFHRDEPVGKEVGDMAAFNLVAYRHFGSRLVYGPGITTDFKTFTDNGTAKFKHK